MLIKNNEKIMLPQMALGCSPSRPKPKQMTVFDRLAILIAKIETTCTYCSKACATPILVMGLFPFCNRGFLMILYYKVKC